MIQPVRPPEVRPPSEGGPRERARPAPGTAEQRRFVAALRGSMSHAWVTRGLVVANVVVFALTALDGAGWLALGDPEVLYRWGANFGPATLEGQWWRLLSSMFLHAGVLHLGFNMYALWIGGRLVERLFGHVGFAALYAFAGVLGSVASVLWDPRAPSVGASGAVFGVFGALLGFLLRRRHLLPVEMLRPLRRGVVTVVVLNVLFGFVAPGIDNAAHLGGLAGGLASGLLLAPSLGGDGGLRRRAALVPLVASAAAGLVLWIALW